MVVRLKDIAKVLGISTTAVSKALNDQPDIGIELKEQVKKISEEMGYKTNTIAKRLKTKRSFTIGLFLLTRYKVYNDDNFGYRFFDGIFEETNKRGYDLVLFSIDSDKFVEKSYMELCLERQVEGAIFIGLGMKDKNLESIVNSNIPISLIDSFIDGEKISTVSTDNEKSVEIGMNYLWDLGHKEIGIIRGHEEAFVSKKRFETYRNFLIDKEKFNKDYIFYGDFTLDGGYKAGKEILKLNNKPSAFFCESDSMAIGALKVFKEEGIKVPEDISIIGFDNLKMSEYTEPALSTLAQDPLNIGKIAAKLVIDQIEEKGEPLNIQTKPKLIERNSCKKIK